MCKSKYDDYCKCDKCYKDKKYCYDCKETAEALKDAEIHATRARISLESIFGYDEPCKNIEVIQNFVCEALENLEKFYCALEFLSKYYEKDCYDCGYETAYFIQSAIRSVRVAIIRTKELKELLCEYKCECIECEGFVLVTIALERTLNAELFLIATIRLFRDKEDPCKKC